MTGSLSVKMPEATPQARATPHLATAVAHPIMSQPTNQHRPPYPYHQPMYHPNVNVSHVPMMSFPVQNANMGTSGLTFVPAVQLATKAKPQLARNHEVDLTNNDDGRSSHARPTSHSNRYPAQPSQKLYAVPPLRPPSGTSFKPSQLYIDLTDGPSSLSPPSNSTRPVAPLEPPRSDAYQATATSMLNQPSSQSSGRSPPSLQPSSIVPQSSSTSSHSLQSPTAQSTNKKQGDVIRSVNLPARPSKYYHSIAGSFRCAVAGCIIADQRFTLKQDLDEHVHLRHAEFVQANPHLFIEALSPTPQVASQSAKPAKTKLPKESKPSKQSKSFKESKRSKDERNNKDSRSGSSLSRKKSSSSDAKSKGSRSSSPNSLAPPGGMRMPTTHVWPSQLAPGSASPSNSSPRYPQTFSGTLPPPTPNSYLSAPTHPSTALAQTALNSTQASSSVSPSTLKSVSANSFKLDPLHGLDATIRDLFISNSSLFVEKFYVDRPAAPSSSLFISRVQRVRAKWRMLFERNNAWIWDAQTDQGQQVRDVMAGKLKGFGKTPNQVVSVDVPAELFADSVPAAPVVESRHSTRRRRSTVVYQPVIAAPNPRRKQTKAATAASPHNKASIRVTGTGNSVDRNKFLTKYRFLDRRRVFDSPSAEWKCGSCGLQHDVKYGCLLRCSGPCGFAYHQRCIELRDIPSGQWWCSEECFLGTTKDDFIALKVALRWKNRGERKKRFGLESFDQPVSNSTRGSRPNENSWCFARATTEPLPPVEPNAWTAAFAGLSEAPAPDTATSEQRNVMKPLSLLAHTIPRDQSSSAAQANRSRKSPPLTGRGRSLKADDARRSNKTTSGHASNRSLRSSSALLPRRSAAYLIKLRVLDRDPNHAECCVCEDGESVEDNEIILCDGPCSCAYHRYCANLDFTPGEDDEWFCSTQCMRAKADHTELSNEVIVQLIQAARDSYEQRGPYVEVETVNNTKHQVRAFYDEIERDFFCPRAALNTFKRGDWRPSDLGLRAMLDVANLIMECASENVNDPIFKFCLDKDDEKMDVNAATQAADAVASTPRVSTVDELSAVPVSVLNEMPSLPSRRVSSIDMLPLDYNADESQPSSLSNSTMLVSSDKAKIAAWIQSATATASSEATRSVSSITSNRTDSASGESSPIRSSTDTLKLAQFAAVLEAPVKAVDEGDRLLAAYYAQVAVNNQTKQELFDKLMQEELSSIDTFCQRQLQDELTIREYLEHEEKMECGTVRDRVNRQQKPYVSYCRCPDCLFAADKALRQELNNQYLRDHPNATMLPHRMPAMLRKSQDGEEIEVEILDTLLDEFKDLESIQLPPPSSSLAVEPTIDFSAMAAALDDGVKQRKRVIEFARAIGNPELLELIDGSDKSRAGSRTGAAKKRVSGVSSHPASKRSRATTTPKLTSQMTRRNRGMVDDGEPLQALDYMEFTSPGKSRRELSGLNTWGWDRPSSTSTIVAPSRSRRASRTAASLPPGYRLARVSFLLDDAPVVRREVAVKSAAAVVPRSPPVLHSAPTLKSPADAETKDSQSEAADPIVPPRVNRSVSIRFGSVLIFSRLPVVVSSKFAARPKQIPVKTKYVDKAQLARFKKKHQQEKARQQKQYEAETLKCQLTVDADGHVTVFYDFISEIKNRARKLAADRHREYVKQMAMREQMFGGDIDVDLSAGRALRKRARLSFEGEDRSDASSDDENAKETESSEQSSMASTAESIQTVVSDAPSQAEPPVEAATRQRPKRGRTEAAVEPVAVEPSAVSTVPPTKRPAPKSATRRRSDNAADFPAVIPPPVVAPIVSAPFEPYSRYTDDQLYEMGLKEDVETDICQQCWQEGELLCCDGITDGRPCTWLWHHRCLHKRKEDRRGFDDPENDSFICPRHVCMRCRRLDRDCESFVYCQWCDHSYCGDCYPTLKRCYPFKHHAPNQPNVTWISCFSCSILKPSSDMPGASPPWLTREYVMRNEADQAAAYRAYLIWLGKMHLVSKPSEPRKKADNSSTKQVKPVVKAGKKSRPSALPPVPAITTSQSETNASDNSHSSQAEISTPAKSDLTQPSAPAPSTISPRLQATREALTADSDDDDELLNVVLARKSTLHLIKSPPRASHSPIAPSPADLTDESVPPSIQVSVSAPSVTPVPQSPKLPSTPQESTASDTPTPASQGRSTRKRRAPTDTPVTSQRPKRTRASQGAAVNATQPSADEKPTESILNDAKAEKALSGTSSSIDAAPDSKPSESITISEPVPTEPVVPVLASNSSAPVVESVFASLTSLTDSVEPSTTAEQMADAASQQAQAVIEAPSVEPAVVEATEHTAKLAPVESAEAVAAPSKPKPAVTRTRVAAAPRRKTLRTTNATTASPAVPAASQRSPLSTHHPLMPPSGVLTMHNVAQVSSFTTLPVAPAPIKPWYAAAEAKSPFLPVESVASKLRPTHTRDMSELNMNHSSLETKRPVPALPQPLVMSINVPSQSSVILEKQESSNIVNKLKSAVLTPATQLVQYVFGKNRVVEPLLLTPVKQRGTSDVNLIVQSAMKLNTASPLIINTSQSLHTEPSHHSPIQLPPPSPPVVATPTKPHVSEPALEAVKEDMVDQVSDTPAAESTPTESTEVEAPQSNQLGVQSKKSAEESANVDVQLDLAAVSETSVDSKMTEDIPLEAEAVAESSAVDTAVANDEDRDAAVDATSDEAKSEQAAAESTPEQSVAEPTADQPESKSEQTEEPAAESTPDANVVETHPKTRRGIKRGRQEPEPVVAPASTRRRSGRVSVQTDRFGK